MVRVLQHDHSPAGQFLPFAIHGRPKVRQSNGRKRRRRMISSMDEEAFRWLPGWMNLEKLKLTGLTCRLSHKAAMQER